jgi:hypothetical protein
MAGKIVPLFVFKIYFIFVLIGLVILVSTSPKKWKLINEFPFNHGLEFFYENLFIGLMAGFSTAMIAYFRQKNVNSILIYFIATFVILVAINLLFQYSGLYYFFYHDFDFYHDNIIYLTINGSILVLFLVFFLQSYNRREITLFFNKNIDKRIYEIIIFMISYAAPFFYIDKNRTGKITSKDISDIIYYMLGFLFLFLVMQFCGIWTSLGLNLSSLV